MKVNHLVIVAGGKLSKSFLSEMAKEDFIIGVDRGALWLLKHGITPRVAIGDFDSVTHKELELIKQKVKEVIEYPESKDATDLELAVNYAIHRKPQKIVIVGGIGTRLDHTMAAVHILEELLKKGIQAAIIDERNEITLVNNSYTITKSQSYRYISILPHSTSLIVSLSGFAYPLVRARLRRGTSRGISNEVIEESATIEVHQGIALVIKSRD